MLLIHIIHIHNQIRRMGNHYLRLSQSAFVILRLARFHILACFRIFAIDLRQVYHSLCHDVK